MPQNTIATIGALATAAQPAGVAIVRVSGPRASSSIHAIFRGKHDPVDDPRRLTFGTLVDYESGLPIDKCLAVFMPGPNSYTGEDIAEFQFHGSPLISEKVLRSIYSFGVVPAEPGEFTKRAYLNGKIDLIQAEAIGDLITATSDRALKFASEQLQGKLSQVIYSIGEPLRDSLAEIEANLDFPEEDISPDTKAKIVNKIQDNLKKLVQLIATYDYGSVVKEGFRVLICGKPNAGKSSLLNLILGKQRAIVTDVSGTTRDLIEEQVTLDGYSFIFCDSAGIRETEDEVEKIGIELAYSKISWADLVLVIADATDEDLTWQELTKELQGKASQIWMVINKIDLNSKAVGSYFCDSSVCKQNLYLSAKTKNGFSTLIKALIEEVKSRSLTLSDEASGIVTNERHRYCLLSAKSALEAAILHINMPLEVISVDLRNALNNLGELIGTTSTEDILGRIFSKFCIGK